VPKGIKNRERMFLRLLLPSSHARSLLLPLQMLEQALSEGIFQHGNEQSIILNRTDSEYPQAFPIVAREDEALRVHPRVKEDGRRETFAEWLLRKGN
jgi:hypothetical protein